jgi:hypothetical protein
LNEYNFESDGYLPIPGWPEYVMNVDLEVWSLPRRVPCKGGRTRQMGERRLTTNDGRVSLCRGGNVRRYHVARDLFPAMFPDVHAQQQEAERRQREAERQRPQVICRHGHPLHDVDPDSALPVTLRLGTPSVKVWGTGNRICLHCTDAPATYPTDNTYSLQHGVDGMPDYPPRPLRSKIWNDGPQLRGGNRSQLAELEWGEHGFTISNSP